MLSAQELEDLKQKQFREFEQDCEDLGGYAYCELGPTEHSKRVCTLPENNLEISLFVPRDSLYASFIVTKTTTPKRKLGVIFEQGKAETITWNVI